MKSENPFSKNQTVELVIDGMTNEGQGVAHLDGVAFFVPDTVVGETVSAHIIKVEKRYCVAKLKCVLVPSPARIAPPCEAYPFCGGCTMQHMTYAEQLVRKHRFVTDALERLGGLTGVSAEPVRGMEHPWRYRNKGSFPFGFVDGRTAFGFYAARSHRLVPLYDCPIQSERIPNVARRVAAWADRYGIPVYDETTGQGVLRACVVRVTTDGETMAVVVTKGKLPHETELKKALSDVESLYHNRNDRNTNVLMGDTFRLLHGKETLVERQSGLTFSVSPQSFLQVNPAQTAVLYEIAVSLLAPQPEETVFDLYCGIGTISLQIAKRAGSVIGIECVPAAIENAKRNALQNGISNAEFLCDLSENALPELLRQDIRPDAILLDPPRKGCEPQVLDAILQSTARRVVYVSCNPATLARDLKTLTAGGFEIQRVQPVDMFPQTAHVETVVLLNREHGTHNMRLNHEPFEMIRNGEKTIELRLFDEKRQKIKSGDEIVFTDTADGRTLKVMVVKVHRFESFEALYQSLPLLQCGYTEESVKTASPSDMEAYYSAEEQKKYGVVGIEILRLHQTMDEAIVPMSRLSS